MKILSWSIPLVLGLALAMGCGRDTTCDSCDNDGDCNEGQFCGRTTSGGRVCFEDGTDSCSQTIYY